MTLTTEQIRTINTAIRVLGKELKKADDGEGYITGTDRIEFVYDQLVDSFPAIKNLKPCDI